MEVVSRDKNRKSWFRGVGGLLLVAGALSIVLRAMNGRNREGSHKGTASSRASGRDWAQVLGTLLLVAGALSLVLAVFFYFADPFASDRVLPAPVALSASSEAPEQASPTVPAETPLPTVAAVASAAAITPTATATLRPTPQPTPTPLPLKPAIPVRMIIPAINLDSKVKEIGTYEVAGQLFWETIPFLVGHYRTSAKIGDNGNAIFSGHVASRNAGNVFADLYKIRLGDEVRVFSDTDEYTYLVTNVKLVVPTETSVMDPTPDPTITLITCAGEWIPAERNYTHRLIVTAKLVR